MIQSKREKQLPELSKIYYVDAQGHLCRRYNFLERVWVKLCLAFRLLPFMVTAILIGLILVEITCFVGLYELMQSKVEYGNSLKIYVALICLIGTIIFFGVRIALFLAERHLEENQNFFQTKKSKKQ